MRTLISMMMTWRRMSELMRLCQLFSLTPAVSAPQVIGELLSHSALFVGVIRFLPPEGLVEEMAVEVEAGFD